MSEIIKVPDIGPDEVEVTEILVKIGDSVDIEQSLITIEGDKASMQVPSPKPGIIKEIMIKIGDKIKTNQSIILIKNFEKEICISSKKNKDSKYDKNYKEIYSADLGIINTKIIKIFFSINDYLEVNNPILIVKDFEKTKTILSPLNGTVSFINVKNKDFIKSNKLVFSLKNISSKIKSNKVILEKKLNIENKIINENIYSSPFVRRIASKFNIDLSKIDGSGRKGRILPEDIKNSINIDCMENKFIDNNSKLKNVNSFEDSKEILYGESELIEIGKIKKISGSNLYKNWISIPHVTQFEQVDISELESFRKNQNNTLKYKVKITILSFIIKSVFFALKEYPLFNSSLSKDKNKLILKKYFNIGIAVSTDYGLVVPVIFDVDKKGIIEISHELFNISNKARNKKLISRDMTGGCFTISNLGGIGGREFTPIINYPEVAILGVSQASIQPMWNGSSFSPKLMLPLSLSYDHRVIDGSEGAKFIIFLKKIISDIRLLTL
ncbi:aceF [Wigglesworthia glossinidia endosymbiont of Glossina brevipalpis]|uniref:Dihydrolipoamide acetyltransferase component of pyruvate dehydrogenase complex n=1 Tax=Wigglesworthia glossinidia brevipalpis TaxID=36870 RepID=Q8D2N2_WIGBR|nr:aceF [Wigglesworthia glossinidia endosymbiont of Glossina brevipalpis]